MMEGSAPRDKALPTSVQVQMLLDMETLAQEPNSFPAVASLGMETDAGMVSV
jgi:hypothetical protein